MAKTKDRWKGLQRITIHLGVFDYGVRVVIGSQDLAVAYYRWFVNAPEDDTVLVVDPHRRGFCAMRGNRMPVLWIPKRPRTPRDHATLAHECFHAVGHVTRWAAIQHSEATEEVFCHALGCLVNGILSEAL